LRTTFCIFSQFWMCSMLKAVHPTFMKSIPGGTKPSCLFFYITQTLESLWSSYSKATGSNTKLVISNTIQGSG
jgi:hypothetical protein